MNGLQMKLCVSITVNMMPIIFLCFYFLSSFILGEGIHLQQFRVVPRDCRVKKGEDVILPCEIDHLAGQVQWTREGEALGVPDNSQEFLGYPRYKFVGSQRNGIANLLIRNVSLEDDAEYECQVGQKVLDNAIIPLIRASANLTVIVPPTSIEIMGLVNNSRVDVRENEKLKLRCMVRNCRPQATLVWYRGKNELRSYHEVVSLNECRVLNKSRTLEVCDVSSTIILKPNPDDDLTNYSCVAKHEALPTDNRIFFATVRLNVLYPPESPHIEGNVEGDPTNIHSEGETLELSCRSNGGNPVAQLKWFRNGEEISKEIFYRIFGKRSENSLKIELKADDNNANYTCSASNGATAIPLNSTTRLSVAFGPYDIKITGVEEARANDSVTLTCKTSASYPPAEIQWVVEDQTTPNRTLVHIEGTNGGMISESILTIQIPDNKRELSVYCYGSNPKFLKQVNAKKTINIYYPPGVPLIRGYSKAGYIIAGTKQELSCTSSGGNPLAKLKWFKYNQLIPSITRYDKVSSHADISIFVNKTDNGAIYRCEAINPTIEDPRVDFVTLKVFFAPDNASINVEPKELHVGDSAALGCVSSSSNPPSEITWLRNGLEITDGVNGVHQPDSFGGSRSLSTLVFNVTSDMHRNTFTCRAMNAVLSKSINIAIELDVLYKPIFVKENYTSVVSVMEGKLFSITLKAHANPTRISFFWRKGALLLNSAASSSTLTLVNISRTDSGEYVCEATNSEGTDYFPFQLNVKYEPEITSISKTVTVNNGSDAEMACTVSGNPLERDNVLWANLDIADFDHRGITLFAQNTWTLKLTRATINDMGLFYCIVNNGIGPEKNASTLLIVEHAPIARKRSAIEKVASNVSVSAKFECRGSGAPPLQFLWFKREIRLNQTVKYFINTQQINETYYQSTLTIKQVAPSDYGEYQCMMQNKLGAASIFYDLIRNSKPDTPSNLTVTNVTLNSVSLSWILEFDGGLSTHFRIKYYAEMKPEDKYSKDVRNATSTTISRLMSGHVYVFEVIAYNQIGESGYSVVKANTSMEPLPSGNQGTPLESEGFIILVAMIFGVILLFLNVLIILICAWRRSKKNEKSLSDQNHKSLEMYANASKNSNDVSFGTLSSMQSVKLKEDDSYGPMRFIPEDINYPFNEKNSFDLQNNTEFEENELYPHAHDVYSSISHIHHLPPLMPPFEFCYNGNFSHNATLPIRKRTPQMSDAINGGLRNISPTPSIPPPMSKISTQAYKSLQCNNYLRI